MSNFNAKFFARNRERLCRLLPGHTVIMTANFALQYSADIAFPFRQDSSFWYLTGLLTPEALLVIDCDSGTSSILMPAQNDYQKEWDGEQNESDIQNTSGADEIIFKYDLNMIFKDVNKKNQKIGYLPALPERVEPYGFYANPARARLESELKKSKNELVDIRRELGALRSVKQPIEIAEIQNAITATGNALKNVKKNLNSYSNEKDIVRSLSSQFHAEADGHGFDPIVAGGKNASIIHYTENNQELGKNELVLLDVGAKSSMYAADISRTWAVGTPSPRQTDIYNAVLDLQSYAMSLVKPGAYLKESQEKVNKKMTKIAKKLKIEQEMIPHGVSHFLGIDVHDAGNYDEPLQPGMVITIEPGIYLADERIGVRIEDDVLVTKTGFKNLSKSIPNGL